MDLGKPQIKPIFEETKLLSVTMRKACGDAAVEGTPVDVTDKVSGRRLTADIPAGVWRIRVNFLDKVEVKGVLAKLGIPDLLTIQRKLLSDLISTGEKWEENSRLLKLQMKKHEEEYRKLISEYETASEGKE